MKNIINTLVFKYIVLVMSLSAIFIFLNIKPPAALAATEEKINDYLMTLRGELKHNNNVVIVDIDNNSLNQVGQWPWSRNIIAKMVTNIANSKANAIAFTIVFAEKDRTSPSNLYNKLNVDIANLEDYDKTLGDTIAKSKIPIILGYHFMNLEDAKKANFLETPYVPAVFVDKDSNNTDIISADGIGLNISSIQDNAYSSGFLNSTPDELGNIRYAPLLISYDNLIYPSLALESVRSIFGTKKVTVDRDISSRYITFDNFNIKVDNLSRMYINFKGPAGTFKHISANDILNGTFSKSDIENKIVIIGSSASGLSSSNNTPFDSTMSSAEIQANIVDNIMANDFLYKPSYFTYIEKLIIVFFIAFIMLSLFINSTAFPIIFYFVGNTIYFTFVYILFAKYNILMDYILIPTSTTLALIIALLTKYILEQRQNSLLKSKFSSKVSKAVMNDLLKNQNNSFTASKRYITIFFSDIKGFTQITEKIDDPEILVDYLNVYMGHMTGVIMKNYGTVDKFIGDSIMAYWNAPHNVENHEDFALTSAIEQQRELVKINEIYASKNQPQIFARMGLNSGYALVGEMGSRERSDYTAIGATVNIAAILEQICKYYDASIIITETVKQNLTKTYTMRLLDLIQVESTNQSFDIYEIFDFELNEQTQNELKAFEKGVGLYRKQEFTNALMIFQNLLESKSSINKTPTRIYINRCKKELNSHEEFSPVQYINKKFILST